MKVTYQSVFTMCQDGNSENNQTYPLTQTCHLVCRTGHNYPFTFKNTTTQVNALVVISKGMKTLLKCPYWGWL